jgi:hypothetical protein
LCRKASIANRRLKKVLKTRLLAQFPKIREFRPKGEVVAENAILRQQKTPIIQTKNSLKSMKMYISLNRLKTAETLDSQPLKEHRSNLRRAKKCTFPSFFHCFSVAFRSSLRPMDSNRPTGRPRRAR